MGGVFEPHWVANARLKLGSPRTIELLPRHNLLAPLGAWSLGKTDRQVVKPLHQANNKETRNHQPYSLLLGTSEHCVLASLTTSSKSMMPEKTAIIDRELSKLKVDIAALQETRLPASGSLKEKDYTFFWQGLEPEERRLYGVGFAVRNTLLSSMEPPSQGTARILSLRLSTPSRPANIFSV